MQCISGSNGVLHSPDGALDGFGELRNLPDSISGGGDIAGVILDAEQVEMAAVITAVGAQMGVTRRGIEIGIAVAMEQSSLRPGAVNGPYLGLFQQNPDPGTDLYLRYSRSEPGGAAWMFFDELINRVPDYATDQRADWEIGEAVQETLTGERFVQYQELARELTAALVDKVSLAADDHNCSSGPIDATPMGSAFDAGNIISDAVFYDTSSMTVEQIRAFIGAQGEECTGSWCLKDILLSTPDMPADGYCSAYVGGVDEGAASVIARVSQACGINPQVTLTTLQKESGMLTAAKPTEESYAAAWGWHCPDTGSGGGANCDPEYAGFFNQAYGMAKQWSRYKNDPDKYNYRAGQAADILWNVAESGCGSAPVAITNTATASLYNYTPYQPNAASLAGYPGVGDRCSAYGVRNFFFLFKKYFGSTGGGRSSATVANGTEITLPDNIYVPPELVGRLVTAPNSAVAAGLAAGFSALGLPYVWGGGGSGAGPNNGCSRGGGSYNSCGNEIGFDCSGLTAYVLNQAGFEIPGDSGSQRSTGTTVSWAQALPGDVVGFPGHVAIYVGEYQGRRYILEAPGVGLTIRVVPITRTDVDDRLYRYWVDSTATVAS